MRKLYSAILVILLLTLPFLFALGATPGAVSRHSNRPFRVGVLASLTGPGSSLGRNTVAASMY
jgi:hypothetical protein